MKKISLQLTSAILALTMLISTAPMLTVLAEEPVGSVVLAKETFEDLSLNWDIVYDAASTAEIASRNSSHADGAFIGCCSTVEQVDSSKKYFIERGTATSPGKVTVKRSPNSDSHGNVVYSTGWRFGISEHNLESSTYTDDMQRNSPPRLKFEFDLYRTSNSKTVTIRYGNPYAGGELFAINSDNTITVYTESLTGTNTAEILAGATAPAIGKWASYALSLDVATRHCVLYIDGTYKGEWTLDDYWSTTHPDFIIGGIYYIDNLKVSVDTDYRNVTANLKNSIAVMNFARNAVVNGNVVEISAENMVITDPNGNSIAPLTFFKNVLGGTVSGSTVILDGVGKDFSGSLITCDGKSYLKLSDALMALGKDVQSFDMITMAGDVQTMEDIKSDSMLLENLKTVLNENQLTAGDVSADDWKLLKDNWRKLLVGSDLLNTDDENVKIKLARVDYLAQRALLNMRTDFASGTPHALFGSSDVSRTEIMTEQYTRLYYIARAYATKGSAYYHDETVKGKILNALEWLDTYFYRNYTWVPSGANSDWDWIVGTPTDLSKTLIIMEDELGSAKVKKYLEPYDYWRLNKTEQTSNRLLARTAIAALREDFDAMRAMQLDYDRTLKTATSGGGVQKDWMYVTHKYYAYTSAYGSNVLAERLVLVQAILSGTKFEFATPYKYNSCMWMYETFAPVMFNGAISSAFSGRFRTAIFSEESYIRYAIGAMLDLIGAFGKDDDQKLKEIIKRNIVADNKTAVIESLEMGQVEKLTDILSDASVSLDPYYISRVYYSGDAAVHQREDFGFALAMSSSRIGAWESISGQNLKGWYQGDGLLLMHLKDDILQYNEDYWEYVNPYHLPGTTVDTQERQAVGISQEYSHLTLTGEDFVGGVTLDEEYSLAAMQLKSHSNTDSHAPIHNSSLRAKKAWFMFDDEVVALGSDINATDGFEVRTIVENRKLKTNTESITVDGTLLNTVTAFQKTFENPKYVNLENSGGYYFPNGGRLVIDKVKNTKNFFEMWFTHDESPEDDVYSYVLLPKKDKDATEEYSLNPDIEILANTKKIQSVRERTLGVTGTVFWEAGTFDNLTVSKPMMVMTKNKNGKYKINISDPTKKLTSAAVKVEGKYSLVSCDSRCSVSTTDAETVITIDFAGAMGRTIAVELKDASEVKGFDTKIVDVNFDRDGYKNGDTIKKSSTSGAISDESGVILLNKDLSVVESDGRVAVEAANGESDKNGKIGIAPYVLKSEDAFYNKTTDTAPKMVKVKFGLKAASDTVINLVYKSKVLAQFNYSTTGRCNFGYAHSDEYSLSYVQSQNIWKDGQWNDIEMYLDFQDGKYHVFINGAFVLTTTLPDGYTAGIDQIYLVASESAKTIYVSDMSVYTIAAYAKPSVAEYTLPTGKEMAFVCHNEASIPKTFNIIKAKYNGAGKLISTTVDSLEVMAATSVLKKVTAPQDVGRWKYFVWEASGLMKPLIETKEF